MSTTIIKVKGMTCKHCVMRVEKSLLDVDSVSDVKISLNTGDVTVEHNSIVDISPNLKTAVEDAGYELE